MAETEAASAPASTKKTKAAAKPKKPKTVASHPKVSEMVNAAIGNLKEKGGSSLQAIKKYISSNYKVDIERLSPFIRKYLKSAVAAGSLVQTKGKGANGSFRMSGPGAKSDKPRKPKNEKAKKAKAAAAAAKSPAKRVAPKAVKKAPKAALKKPKAKKAAAPKKTKAAKPKAKKAKAAKSPKKLTKTKAKK